MRAGLRALAEIALAHLLYNALAIGIWLLALLISLVSGPDAGLALAVPLSGVMLLLLPMLWGRLIRQRSGEPREFDATVGYVMLLALGLVICGIGGSWLAGRALQKQLAGVERSADLLALREAPQIPAYFEVHGLKPKPGASRSLAWVDEYQDASRLWVRERWRLLVVPLQVADNVDPADPDRSCVWLAQLIPDYPSTTANQSLHQRWLRDELARLESTEPRWLLDALSAHGGGRSLQRQRTRYRDAVGGLTDAERGCTPRLYAAVAGPAAERRTGWMQLAWLLLAANGVPPLLLGLWWLGRRFQRSSRATPGRSEPDRR